MRLWKLTVIGLLWSVVSVQAADRQTILKSCHEVLRMSATGCKCIADRVESEFNDAQRAFFMGIITKDRTAMAAAQKNLAPDDMTFISGKMEQMPQECAGG